MAGAAAGAAAAAAAAATINTAIKPIECRWGILGSGQEAARFVAELQASSSKETSGGGSSSSTSNNAAQIPSIRHTIIAIASSSVNASRAFADTHIHSASSSSTLGSTSFASASNTLDVFGTSTEVHAHPSVDSVFIACPQRSRYQEAASALRAGKSVLVSKPLAITSHEARALCEMTSKEGKRKWLGFLMRTVPGKESLLQAAQDCAISRDAGEVQSPSLPWSDSLAVFEALDEIRDEGAIQLPADNHAPPSFPRMKSDASSSGSNATMDNSLQFKRRISSDTSKRPSSRASMSSDTTGCADDNVTSASLRSQLHELKHVLRQKNALITSLERGTGTASIRAKTSRSSLPPQATVGLHTPQAPVHRRRTTSLENGLAASPHSDDDINVPITLSKLPLSDVLNTVEGRLESPNALALSRRKRRDANGGHRSSTPDRGNSLGLSTVKEGNSSTLVLGEGFLAPTIASENRRLANTSGGSPRLGTPTLNGLASPILSPGGTGGGGKGTSRVIETLTTELNEARTALDETKLQLRSSQRAIAALQRSCNETKESLGRSRTENERLGQMMSRKERQIQEALERARKAEVEAKELGKSSREWGARVRKVEAELGEERMHKQRAEVQYEAVTSSWKSIREAWEKEMNELRESQGDAVHRNREEAQNLLAKFQAAESHWRGREEEGAVLKGVIAELEMERKRATTFVEGPVRELVTQLQKHEKMTSSQDAAVAEVEGELKRILRLMRTPAP